MTAQPFRATPTSNDHLKKFAIGGKIPSCSTSSVVGRISRRSAQIIRAIDLEGQNAPTTEFSTRSILLRNFNP